jgi:hypothetical protein
MRNARIWEESKHAVRYWGPVDASEWFEVVYRFDMDFPVIAASLCASVDLNGADSSGFLEVSSAGPDWVPVVVEQWNFPGGGLIDISRITRGARQVLVRARMKGRDDNEGSCLAQFLRTSTLPDGHANLKTPYVFELKAYDREVPIVTGTARFSDGWLHPLWISEDGTYELERRFFSPGKCVGTISVRAGRIAPISKSFALWINTPGWNVQINPMASQIQEMDRYQADGRLVADSAGLLPGIVDYGDGSSEQVLVMKPDAGFRLDHDYRTAGRFRVRVTIRDGAGHMATALPICVVAPRGESSQLEPLIDHRAR